MATRQAVGGSVPASELADFRQLVFQMSDNELLRFGVTTKFKYFSEPAPVPEDVDISLLAEQLEEARVEWIRRFPHLPLRVSF